MIGWTSTFLLHKKRAGLMRKKLKTSLRMRSSSEAAARTNGERIGSSCERSLRFLLEEAQKSRTNSLTFSTGGISFACERRLQFLTAEHVLAKRRLASLRMVASDELVWPKRTFLTAWRIKYTVGWKNTFGEVKIAVRQAAHTALLCGRLAGEVHHA